MRSAPDRTGSSVPVRRARPEVDFQINHSSFDVEERREHTNLHLSSVHLLLYQELPPLCCPFSTLAQCCIISDSGVFVPVLQGLPPTRLFSSTVFTKQTGVPGGSRGLPGRRENPDGLQARRIGLKTAGIDPFLIRSCRTDALPNHICRGRCKAGDTKTSLFLFPVDKMRENQWNQLLPDDSCLRHGIPIHSFIYFSSNINCLSSAECFPEAAEQEPPAARQ